MFRTAGFYVSIGKVFQPRGSCAGTRAGCLFPMVRFWYKSACDTRADNSNRLGGGPGSGDVDDGGSDGGCVVGDSGGVMVVVMVGVIVVVLVMVVVLVVW